MNGVLWIMQILLALLFAMVGSAKLMTSKAKLVANPNMAWAEDFSEGTIKAIGLVEVLAAIGLILPWALNIAPILTPLAALGLVADMLGAAFTHYRRGETKVIPFNLILLALAAFVAWGRFTGAS